MLGRIAGHAWTIGADLRHRVRPWTAPTAQPWSVVVEDPVGPTTLTGVIRHEPAADTIVVAVHGLGGSADSGYCVRLAAAAAARGWSCLRINLRGADGLGIDVYHAGLVGDLVAALRTLDGYARVFVVGFSLGGHAALHLGIDPPPRVAKVAAVGSPLDLAKSCAAFDRRRTFVYRNAVLGSLKAAYAELARVQGDSSARVPTPLATVNRVRTIYDWDAAVVVPRHGFNSVAHYHRTMSIGPRLPDLRVPCLYIGSRHDPMVPAHTLRPWLAEASPLFEAELLDNGGHVAFPARVGVDERVLDWFAG